MTGPMGKNVGSMAEKDTGGREKGVEKGPERVRDKSGFIPTRKD